MDHTLIDSEIAKAARERGLISPFRDAALKGASYDFGAGDTVIIAHPTGVQAHSLSIEGVFKLNPGHSCIVSSLERIKVSGDMKGRLSLRAHQQLRGLFFPGGIIDPGYNGFLFFPIANLSDSPVEIKFQEALVTGEFVRLDLAAGRLYNNGQEILRPQQLPLNPKRTTYDLLRLSEDVDNLCTEVKALKATVGQWESAISSTQRLQDWVYLTALGGVMAGGIFGLYSFLPDRFKFYAVVAAVAVSTCLLLLRTRRSAR